MLDSERERKIQLDSKQRVKSAIQHEPTDRVPKGELLIEDELVHSTPKNRNADSRAKVAKTHTVVFADKMEFVSELKLDLISLHPKYPIVSRDFPPVQSILWADLKEWVEQSGLFTFAVLDGVMGWGVRIFGYTDFLILTRKPSLNLEEFRTRVIALNIQLAECLIASGIDGLILADDLAHRQGLLFSPGITKDYFLSSLMPQVEKIAQSGIPVFFHSDGNLNQVIQEIVDIGFNGLHCIDKNSGMDILQLQRDHGSKLTLWGGLSVEDIIKSEDNDYRLQLSRNIALLDANKGYILGTDSGLFPGINYNALVKIYSETEGRK